MCYLSLFLQENLVFIQHILSHSSAKKKKKKIKIQESISCLCEMLSPSPARSLKPLRPKVLIMQILSHLLEVLHVSTNTETLAIIYSHTRGR